MLGKDKISNYHVNFIVELSKYQEKLDTNLLAKQEKDFLINLTEHWPSKLFQVTF